LSEEKKSFIRFPVGGSGTHKKIITDCCKNTKEKRVDTRNATIRSGGDHSIKLFDVCIPGNSGKARSLPYSGARLG
jgi:hypothetical protein